MATKLYSYRVECEKAGVAIYVRARDEKDAWSKLIGHPGYWQANKRHKVTKKDWVIKKEI